MAEEHAGIYWPKKPEADFYDLPEESQQRLADFMEARRAELEASGGGNRDGLAAVWQPGWAVSWAIRLKPQYRRSSGKGRVAVSEPLGTYYRIEVLEIWKFS